MTAIKASQEVPWLLPVAKPSCMGESNIPCL